MRLIGSVTNRGLAALSEAWAGIREMTFKINTTESNPQLVQIVPPNEVVVVVGFELKMSNRAGTMNLCIPYNVIEPVVDELSAQSWFSAARTQRSEETEGQIALTLSRAGLVVTGLLAETTITLRDLIEMSVGDLIVTEKSAKEPAIICVEGEKKHLAHIGQYKGARAMRVIRPIVPGDRASDPE
jgi:flagellar motor switch protein FliM